MNPKPKKGAYARKRKRDKKAAAFAREYGNGEYVQAITKQQCIIETDAPPELATPCVYILNRSEAAHVEKRKRKSEWATWRGLFPACSQHHAEQEGNTVGFEWRYGVDTKQAAMANAKRHWHLVPVVVESGT